jgi:tetratricopeptide (TPR) repeat protein
VLYASLLENAGIATALVDYPGHIFLLFDTGIGRQESYKLPLEDKRYVVYGDRLWIPVEVTRVDRSFEAAWQAGLAELAKLPALEWRERVVTTAAAWQDYPATSPGFPDRTSPPTAANMQESFAAHYDRLSASIDDYIDETYLDPIKAAPEDNALRTRLLKVYLALHQVDEALRQAGIYLLDERGDKATTYNHMGNAYVMNGDLVQAALQYKQAAALRPDDPGIQHNLEQAMQSPGTGAAHRFEPGRDY